MREFKSLDNQMLDIAIGIAVKAHAGVPDKGDKPYILHPIHLMMQLDYDVVLSTIAILHDAVEDSNLTLDDLRSAGFSVRVVDGVDGLTHRDSESYEDYIERVAQRVDTIKVKRKDLQHNLDVTRLRKLDAKSEARVVKYHAAFMYLTEVKRSLGSAYYRRDV